MQTYEKPFFKKRRFRRIRNCVETFNCVYPSDLGNIKLFYT